RFLAVIRDEHDVILAVPLRMTQGLVVHSGPPSCALGGSRRGLPLGHPRNCQTSNASPPEAAGLPLDYAGRMLELPICGVDRALVVHRGSAVVGAVRHRAFSFAETPRRPCRVVHRAAAWCANAAAFDGRPIRRSRRACASSSVLTSVSRFTR